MMAKHALQTGQLAFTADGASNASPYIALAPAAAPIGPETRKGYLYILLEPTAFIDRGVLQGVLKTLRKVYYDDHSYSVTASLREALRRANEQLYKRNVNQPTHKRVLCGATCVVRKDNDLHVAQVSPAQAYLYQNEQVRAMPVPPFWKTGHTSTASFGTGTPLGTSLFTDPELFRGRWEPGACLLVVSSNLTATLPAPATYDLLQQPDSAAVLATLHDHCATHALTAAHAFVLRLHAAPAAQPVATPRTVSGAPIPADPWQRLRERMSRRPAEDDAPHRRQTVSTPPPLEAVDVPLTPEMELGDDLATHHQRARAALHQRTPTFRTQVIDLPDPELASSAARPLQPRYVHRPLSTLSPFELIALPVTYTRAWWQDRQQRQAFQRKQAGRRRSHSAIPDQPLRLSSMHEEDEKPRRSFPLMFLVALSLAVALLVVYGQSLATSDAERRAASYLDEAEARLAAVYAEPDPFAATDRLSQFDQAMQELRTSPVVTDTNARFWLRYQDLETQFGQLQASLFALSNLDDARVLVQHPLEGGRFAGVVVPPANVAATDETSLTAVNNLYMMDGSTEDSRVFEAPLDGGEPQVILTPGDEVGNTIAGPLKSYAWRLDNITAIDQGANGFGYFFRSGEQWNYTRLGGSEIWAPRGRIDVEVFQGNLYIWGAEENELLKYDSGRYGDIPELWLDPAAVQGYDISQTVDVAIDGQIYLLQPDGRVLVLTDGGVERELVPAAVDPPLTAVTRMVVTGTPNDGFIFLLDTLNERIVQLDKRDGRVIQQIIAPADGSIEFNALLDFAVDTTRGRPAIYLVNSGQIVHGNLPAPPIPYEQLRADAIATTN